MNNGNNIKNIIKVTLATTALTFGILNFNSTSADAKTLTYKEAAQKIANTAKKAYNEKKKVTVKVTVPCAGNTARKIGNAEIKTENAVLKVYFPEELEKGDVVDVQGFVIFDNSFREYGFSTKEKYNNKSLTLTTTINGKNKNFRDRYEDKYYTAANIKELKEVTKGMTAKEKAWRVATWLMVDHRLCYSSKYHGGVIDSKKIYKNHEYTKECGANCEGLANTYTAYARYVGLEVGEVSGRNHKINAIKIDGTVYYVEMQEVFSRNKEWVYNSENYPNFSDEEKEDAKSYLDECRIGAAATGYPWELSECDYAMLTFKEANKFYKDFMGNPKKWLYEYYDKDDNLRKAKGDTSILFNNK